MLKSPFKILFVILIFGLFFYYSCDTKTSSEGDFDKIIVFADSTLYHEIEPALDNIFDNFVHTPHAERSFYHKWAPLTLLDSYKNRRNIILVGMLDQDDPVSDYVQKMLSPQITQKIQNGEIFEIFKEDLFAFDQMGVILCASNKEQLLSNLSINAESIFERFEDYYFDRLSQILFSSNEQYEIEDFFAKEYGWTIKVPYAYQLVERSRDSNFVWIKRTDPSRSVFVFRTKSDKSNITEEWIRNVRDSLATVYFQNDSVLIEDTYIMHTEYNEIPAVKMVGIWQNHELFIGGPFRTYVFYEEKSDYIYFIDISVVAPGKRKKPFIDQLEVIARTFKTVPKEKK